MRILTTLLALFSCSVLVAQPYSPTEGRELPRGFVMPYYTAAEADSAIEKHRYATPVTEWTEEGNRLTADIISTFAWTNRQVMLHIESAPADYELWINGRRTAVNRDGNSPADYNITKRVKEGRNRVEIVLNRPSDLAPIESWKTGSEKLGKVWVVSSPTMGVRDVLVSTSMGEESPSTATAEVGIIVKSYALNPRTVRIFYELDDPAGRTVVRGQSDLTLSMRGEDTVRLIASVPDTLLWRSDKPQHHTLRIRTQREGRYSEYHQYPLGLRTIGHAKGKLLVNGREEALQIVPCTPDATPEHLAEIRQSGANTIRLNAGAVASHLYAVCDTLGLYVIAQAPIDSHKAGSSRAVGGNPSNDPAWVPFYLERVENSYHSSKRHPSVVGFSIATSSANGIALYESFLRMKAMETNRPVIYPSAEGEWNTDRIE